MGAGDDRAAGPRQHGDVLSGAADQIFDATWRAVQDSVPSLSPREREVLRMVASGYTSAEIGSRLMISAMTVNTHIKNIYRKLQVRTRAQAVRFASLRGLF